MKTLTPEEAECLVDQTDDAPLSELKDPDQTPGRRALLESLERRGYLRTETRTEPIDDEWEEVYDVWVLTPYGKLALDCYRASRVLT